MDENRVRYYVTRYLPHDLAQENSMLLDRLSTFSAMV